MKIGRNDPCPCGSGKKYKKCHGALDSNSNVIDASARFGQGDEGQSHAENLHSLLSNYKPSDSGKTFMETLGTPNAATAELKRLKDIMAGKHFETKAEVEAFIKAQIEAQSVAGIEDFLGLSSTDMRLILHEPAKAFDRLLELKGPLTSDDAEKIPLLREALYLLEKLKVEPLRLTSSGYLPPDFVGAWFDASFSLAEDQNLRAILRPKRESNGYDIRRVRTICEHGHLVIIDRGSLFRTNKGVELSTGPDYLALYRDLFIGLLELYADEKSDLNERVPWLAGHSILFGLYILGKKARATISREDMAKIYAAAFPAEQGLEEEQYRAHFVVAGCVKPAIDLGLIEERATLAKDADTSIRIGPLYERILKWR